MSYLFSDGHEDEFELLFCGDGARALVTDVLECSGDVDLLGAFRHAVQYHVDEAVRPCAAGAIAGTEKRKF